MGFWKKLRKLTKFALPIISRVAPFIPGGAVASTILNTASPHLRRAGLMGHDGIGSLYQAPDGSLYGVAEEPGSVGYFAADELSGPGDLDGMDAAELDGMDAAELDGIDAAELDGLSAEDVQGFAEDQAMNGFAAQDLDGMDAGPEHDQSTQGYVRQPGVNGVDAYVPTQAPATPWFTEPSATPGIWKPHW
jgi:hypothetical protein